MSMMYTVKIVAQGEVRDADGNLVSTPSLEGERTVSGTELNLLSLEPEEK